MQEDTRFTTLGRDHHLDRNTVNPPVYHASTVRFSTLATMEQGNKDDPGAMVYGRFGTPTIFALQDAVAELEGGHASLVCPSGLSAITATLLAFARPGSHLLVADCVYGPTRRFCNTMLAAMGVSTTYFDPLHPDPASLLTDKTAAVFVESPGSLTLEVQDIPRLTEACSGRSIPVIMDNTWASPVFFKPFDHGVNISIQAATKYISGHSDIMLGMVTCDEQHHELVAGTIHDLGLTAGPDDCYLALRGLRTLGVRMRRHERNGLDVAAWLAQRSEVDVVMHPAMSAHPGHAVWKRDFSGSSGLFSFVMDSCSHEALAAMLDSMELFSMGYSFGGFESLILPINPSQSRTASPWQQQGQAIRLSIGLEHPDDLIRDLERGFNRLHEVDG